MAAWTGNLLERTNLGWIPSIWRPRVQASINRWLVRGQDTLLFIFNKEAAELGESQQESWRWPSSRLNWTDIALRCPIVCCVSQLSMFYIKKYQVMQYAVVLVLVLVVSMCNVPSQSCSQSDYQKKNNAMKNNNIKLILSLVFVHDPVNTLNDCCPRSGLYQGPYCLIY